MNLVDNSVTTFLGTGVCSNSGDNGPATSATICTPFGLWQDSNYDTYVSDTTYCVIRKVTAATGIVTKYAGTSGSCSNSGDNGLEANTAYGVFYYPLASFLRMREGTQVWPYI